MVEQRAKRCLSVLKTLVLFWIRHGYVRKIPGSCVHNFEQCLCPGAWEPENNATLGAWEPGNKAASLLHKLIDFMTYMVTDKSACPVTLRRCMRMLFAKLVSLLDGLVTVRLKVKTASGALPPRFSATTNSNTSLITWNNTNNANCGNKSGRRSDKT